MSRKSLLQLSKLEILSLVELSKGHSYTKAYMTLKKSGYSINNVDSFRNIVRNLKKTFGVGTLYQLGVCYSNLSNDLLVDQLRDANIRIIKLESNIARYSEESERYGIRIGTLQRELDDCRSKNEVLIDTEFANIRIHFENGYDKGREGINFYKFISVLLFASVLVLLFLVFG